MKFQYTAIILLMISCSTEQKNAIHTNGIASPFNRAEIRPEVLGKLAEIHFNDGQQVNEGDILFSIDPNPALARLESAVSIRLQNVSKLQYAAEKVDRYKKLLKANYVSELDSIHYISELTNIEAIVMQNETEIRLAKIALENCQIKAPFSGFTGRRSVNNGDIIENNLITLVQINQIDPIYIDFTLSEKEYNQLSFHPNCKILISNSNDKNQKEVASLSFVDNEIREHKINLRATARNSNYNFLPGQAIKITILLE